jgi:hypothetical protein
MASTAALDPLYNIEVQMPNAWLSFPAIHASKEFSAVDEGNKSASPESPFSLVRHEQSPNVGSRSQRGAGNHFFLHGSYDFPVKDQCHSYSPTPQILTDLNFCPHPYDKRAVIEGLCPMIEFTNLPTYAAIADRRIEGPSGTSDEEIWEHRKRSTVQCTILKGPVRWEWRATT